MKHLLPICIWSVLSGCECCEESDCVTNAHWDEFECECQCNNGYHLNTHGECVATPSNNTLDYINASMYYETADTGFDFEADAINFTFYDGVDVDSISFYGTDLSLNLLRVVIYAADMTQVQPFTDFSLGSSSAAGTCSIYHENPAMSDLPFIYTTFGGVATITEIDFANEKVKGTFNAILVSELDEFYEEVTISYGEFSRNY